MKYLIVSLLSLPLIAAPVDYEGAEKEFRSLLSAMVEADTTNPPGNEERIVKIVADRYKKEGIAFEITEFGPGRKNIIARLKGSGAGGKPVMVIAHTDVVGTADQAWTTENPHKVTEKDGYLIGRGVSDDLGMAAAAVQTILLIKRSGVPLRRDVIVALTGDEETGGTGIQQVLKDRPDLVDAEIAINEGGGLVLDDKGKMKLVNLQVGEKIYEDFVVTAKGVTGHSSVPQPENAIYRLSKALTKLANYKFPIRLLPVTRSYLKERAPLEKEPLAGAIRKIASSEANRLPASALRIVEGDLNFSTLLRTTCVATMLKGGTKENALAPSASANINCRVLPDDTAENVKRELAKVFQDPTLEIKGLTNPGGSPPSPLAGPALVSIKRVVGQMWPGLPIIPTISRGATDSRYLREHGIASYGLSPLANAEADAKRAHGIDERIPVSSIKPGLEFLLRLVLDLAA